MLKAICPEASTFSEEGLASIREYVELFSGDLSREELVKQIYKYHILFVRMATDVDEKLLRVARNLRLVVTVTTGTDHIDTSACHRLGIGLISLNDVRKQLVAVTATAEYTLALLLALVRRIPCAIRAVDRTNWVQYPYIGMQLSGKRLGLIGVGRLGRLMAKYGLALEMRVFGFDPYEAILPTGVVRCQSVEALLAQSDIVSIHVPLTDETKGLLGDRELRLLPQGAYLVNTSRGEVIDEMALVRHLKCGRMAGAALDVVRNERSKAMYRSELLLYASENDNVLITPHIGGMTRESIRMTDRMVVDEFVNWLHGQSGS